MSLLVTEAGILDTVQDLGRHGFATSGINPGGVMDIAAATIANHLTGNDENEAVIEIHYPASSFYFEQTALIALAGADLGACAGETPVPLNTPVVIKAGTTLHFKKPTRGSRSYLAVKGGFLLEKWLGSYSTNIKAQAGGMNGRPLRKNDRVAFHALSLEMESTVMVLPWHADVAMFYDTGNTIRIIKGKEYDLLTDCSQTIIEGNTFSISVQSDRMGYRMNGSPLRLADQKEMISSAVTRGTIQLLPNGQLIILMADHQTTGGYPRLGHVISADLSALAQVQPNTALRFRLVSLSEAGSLSLQQYHHLQQIKTACQFRLQQYLHEHGIGRS